MPASTLEQPTTTLPTLGVTSVDPVTVEGDSILLHPDRMELGRFYVVELKGSPYIYRRVSDTEVEVYGLLE